MNRVFRAHAYQSIMISLSWLFVVSFGFLDFFLILPWWEAEKHRHTVVCDLQARANIVDSATEFARMDGPSTD